MRLMHQGMSPRTYAVFDQYGSGKGALGAGAGFRRFGLHGVRAVQLCLSGQQKNRAIHTQGKAGACQEKKMKEMLRYGMILGIICLVATGLLAAMNNLTKDKIADEAHKELQASLQEVSPEARDFQEVKEGEKILYYKAFDANKRFVGIAFVATGKGYSSVIETLAGLRPDGTISAIKVLRQNETPGLGSRITEVQDPTTLIDYVQGKKPQRQARPWFQEQFTNKKINEVDSVQAITGATISSRAVIDAVRTKAEELQKIIPHE